MAVSASFNNGILSTFGDGLANSVAISRDAAGNILVNGGAVKATGIKPTVANTTLLQVFGLDGDDVLSLNEANGALPAANLFGGSGNDTLIGGSGADMLFGGAGNDVMLGKGGADSLFGGTGNDVLTGGDGDDSLFGEAGDDRLVWNPGDDSDLFEGGSGIDTAEINGGNGAEHFTISANGARVRIDRVDPAPFHVDAGTMETIVINANGGNDHVSVAGNMAALASIIVDGGAGNDTILGGNGNDTILGGDGNDLVDGNQGNDLALLGAGDDMFVWDPGDGSDVVEGQAGLDTIRFNASAAGEKIDLQANGGRLMLTRDIGNITMDANDVERVDIQALAGADVITLHDLSATDVTTVNVSLAASLAGGAGDQQADTVRLEATNGNDVVQFFGAGTSMAALGLSALVNVTAMEAGDTMLVRGLGGDDVLLASTLTTPMKLVLDGGTGNDMLSGSSGADVLIGGDGNDFVDGNQGADQALLGAGNDSFLWNPGDGNDAVEGGAGQDRLVFNGSSVSENIAISANGGRALLTRDVAAVTMDLNDVETIDFAALNGADTIVVGNLAGTEITRVAIDLAATGNAAQADGSMDQVVVNGTASADVVGISGGAGSALVFGLPAQVAIAHSEGALDRLTVDGGAGNDVLDATALAADTIGLTLRGGLGADVMLGSAGDDQIVGGDGNDLALLGAGNDVFFWSPGDDNDIVEGQAGFDTLQFQGSNVSEKLAISANGGRALLTRDVAAVTMDLNDVENIQTNALGGTDSIIVNDLGGTDVNRVSVDLGGAPGAGDGQVDTVTLNATNGDDVIVVSRSGSTVTVSGLAMDLFIFNFDLNDHLVINGLGGDDVIDASGLSLGSLQFTADGGAGDDVLIGGAGGDVLIGGAGDDVMIGGLGFDFGFGGTGDNIFIQ